MPMRTAIRPLTGRRPRVPRRPQTAHPALRWSVRAGSLDDPSWFRAERDVWIGGAQPWDILSPGTVKSR